MTLQIVEGDLTAQVCDALVNAANDHLWMGGGVAGALKAKGGGIIEREAMALGPIRPGEAVVTGAGQLPVRHIVHAAVMGQDLRTDERLIRQATKSALEAAGRMQLASIAFPALGTGVGGFPLARAASVMIDVVADFSHAPGSLRDVRVVLYDRSAFDVFVRIANERFGPSTADS